MGNISESSLSEIWKDDPVKRYRNLFSRRQTSSLSLSSTCFQAPRNFSRDVRLFLKGWEEEKLVLGLHSKCICNL
ncbi:MAG: hypothetical protein JRJ43_05670 [Deltaproteobacteria bacterium]|nr:hypothetical protein [Deltaproteobacteria bacterium]MBW1719037.1 hypothetical protein [Deltaproteobacteria bacterium]MBW1932158.1 hypothetical protein [Deltaproteobacteria bacterium]MBW1937563.1 hypothetical protein [Deltaproteobacteria bacterium]MBW1963597.1 hypothetical protein [Deltaproteobacteria bacterium]